MSNSTIEHRSAELPRQLQQEHEEQMETVLPSIEPWTGSEDEGQSLQYFTETLRLVEEQSIDYMSPPYSDHSSTQQSPVSSQETVQGPEKESSLATGDIPPRNPSRDLEGYSFIRSTGTSEWSQAVHDRVQVREAQTKAPFKSTTEPFKQGTRVDSEQEMDPEESPSPPRQRSTRQDRNLWQRQSEPWLYSPGVYIIKSEDGEVAVKLSEPILKKE